MNLGFSKLHALRHVMASLAVSLFFAPAPATAQTYYGSGSATNGATSVPNLAFGFNALSSVTTGDSNTAMGYRALFSTAAGNYNAAYGYQSLLADTTGSANTAAGYSTLASNTTGGYNAAMGFNALYSNTTGSYNTASGALALFSNTTGTSNSAFGDNALNHNTTGGNNTAAGLQSLASNTTGSYNTASGVYALYLNTTGDYNTANGTYALWTNSTGSNNVGNGYSALYNNTTGSNNVANGYQALLFNTTGSNNIANGSYALYANKAGNYNTATGLFALYKMAGDGLANPLTAGNNNIGIGYGAGQNITKGSNNIIIGNVGAAADSAVIRIGTQGTQQATYIAGISGIPAGGGVAVYVNANGQLGTLTSSRRFKYDINAMRGVSDRLMDLRPVSFRYKVSDQDGSHPIQYGLIAEEVAKVYPDMVQYDKDGKPFTVFYQQLTPMMLNEIQKAHQHATAQDAKIDHLESEMAELKQTLHKQTAGASQQANQQPLFNALVLAVCVAGALFVTSKTRQAR